MTSLSKNTSIEKQQEIPSIDSSLKELVIEAKALFGILDSTSSKIRELESSLSELKAHFPFRHLIAEETESMPKPSEDHHRAAYPYVHGYRTKVLWYLAWEKDDSSKNYRLFLISEEIEIVSYSVDDDKVYLDEINPKILSKKPLIETDLSTRLHHSEHLLPFINSFKEYIKSSRISIEKGKVLPLQSFKERIMGCQVNTEEEVPF